uniref:Uncharacterized protein n=1 Tax=Craspedostauros australis TaxID=1486917 RepID=A0A6T6HP39_9STRA|mmetsp:Transcript_6253/g.16977  ORF Transcript_6253/g.16977 Transcript_6253/m.16977 type:complete len:335 (+) Transcript_6253:209-1213(+)|eukprot:CAMPEP_0198112708 /NCGR_PEP_ID=MMETSP1442-20131203/4511_1 /TAXON_ID= /ORGANISM="Craspedostauros australis, Strain CCMP3328" /LENGTH=334 /DNA_ID=CAMNT_0043769577 /DNA_START=208 /DNA_END=1212 /DNA_ORIENTATION=+
MRPVSGASSGKNAADGAGGRNKFAYFAAAGIAIFFVLALSSSSGGSSSSQAPRSGQITQHTKVETINVVEDTKSEGDEEDKIDGKSVNEIVKSEEDKLGEVEGAKVDEMNTILEKKLKTENDWMTKQVNRIFGKKHHPDILEEGEIAKIAEKCVETLESRVKDDIKQKADKAKSDEMDKLKAEIESDTADGEEGKPDMSFDDIKAEENMIEVELRDEVETIVNKEEDDIHETAAAVLKEVIEAQLKEKTGDDYEVTVSKDKIKTLKKVEAAPKMTKAPLDGKNAKGAAPVATPSPTKQKKSKPTPAPTPAEESADDEEDEDDDEDDDEDEDSEE